MTTRYDETARNVLGGELASCSTDPVTGFYRNGCCETVCMPVSCGPVSQQPLR